MIELSSHSFSSNCSMYEGSAAKFVDENEAGGL